MRVGGALCDLRLENAHPPSREFVFSVTTSLRRSSYSRDDVLSPWLWLKCLTQPLMQDLTSPSFKKGTSLLSAVVSMELDDIDHSKEAKLTEITDLCWHNMHTETLFTCKMYQVMRTIDGQNPNTSQPS